MRILHRRLSIFAAAWMLAGSAGARAQTAPATTPETSAPRDTIKLALIHQLLTETHAVDQGISAIDALAPAQRAANPRIPAVFWDSLVARAHAGRAELEQLVTDVYARHFTTDELRDLLAFYQTPTGRKLVAALPAVTQESLLAGQEWGRKLGIAVAEQLQKQGIRIDP